MSELLFEIFSEEIPARMQEQAARSLMTLITESLKKAELTFSESNFYYTPRRLTVHITGVPSEQKSYSEEVKGPRTNAAEAAINGYLRKNNIQSIEDCIVKEHDGAEYYFIEKHYQGGKTVDLLGPLLLKVIEKFTWPKSMRWGKSTFRWVRPLHNVLALLDGDIIPGKLQLDEQNSIEFNDITFGHRFLSDGKAIKIKDFADYKAKLDQAGVIVDQNIRRQKIIEGITDLARKHELSIKSDEKLLSEVVGLVEFPVPFIGSFSEDFLSIPSEVISTSMRENQRYFSVLDKDGKVTNRFICVANIIPDDDGKTIIYGNEKVLRARLSDARFFWDQDKNIQFETFMPKLESIRFHEKLGTMAAKAERLKELAKDISTLVGADPKKSARAGWLAKADLVTAMVREFPELQGIMGGYYARLSSEDNAVAEAIASHYTPAGPDDSCPQAPEAIAVALADKIDTLVGFFSIDEKPTGNKDPYALRRAALGVIRIIIENSLHVSLLELLEISAKLYKCTMPDGLYDFIMGRFRNTLQEKGISSKITDAVLGANTTTDLLDAQTKMLDMTKFLGTEQGNEMSAIIKRTLNILKSAKLSQANIAIKESALASAEEKSLYVALNNVTPSYNDMLKNKKYTDAMQTLAALHKTVNNFFDNNIIMDPNEELRNNRLGLLQRIEKLFQQFANFEALY